MASMHLIALALILPLVSATTIKYCDNSGDYVVKVSDVKISPNPVIAGQPASFDISASSGRALSGGKVLIRVMYFGIQVHTETHDICDKMQQAQQMDRQFASAQFQDQLEAFTPERDDPYVASKGDGQRGWDRDGPPPSNSMGSHMSFEGQGGDASRSYYHSLRPDLRPNSEKQAESNIRSHSHDKELNAGYDQMPLPQTFEGLEQNFLDDIMNLSKELHDAEDAENARHREKLNTIDAQYQKQLESLRSRHATRRDGFLRRESSARQHQYQQAVMDHQYQNRGMAPRDPQNHGDFAGSASVGETNRPYNSVDQYESYGDRARYPGGRGRDQFEHQGPFHGGRGYEPPSRFY